MREYAIKKWIDLHLRAAMRLSQEVTIRMDEATFVELVSCLVIAPTINLPGTQEDGTQGRYRGAKVVVTHEPYARMIEIVSGPGGYPEQAYCTLVEAL